MIVFFRRCAVSVLLAASFPLQAQQFTYKAAVNAVPADSFYGIALSPAMKALSRPGWEDLRLMDEQGNEVPYLLRPAEPRLQPAAFVPYPVSGQETGDSLQHLVVEHRNKEAIDHIVLELDQADAQRMLSVSGSNDRQQWYAVRDAFYFNADAAARLPRAYKIVSFPSSSYRYYRITISNGGALPLNIKRAGYLQQQQTLPAAYERVPGISFTQTDSTDRHSYIRLSCNPANVMDRLVLHISGPAQYHREGTIQVQYMEQISATRSVQVVRSLNSFTLSSDKELAIQTGDPLSDSKTGTYLLVIDNHDNVPLHIDSITAWQMATTLVAKLEQNKRYGLFLGDSTLSLPDYDIVYFREKIPADVPFAEVGQFLPLEQKTVAAPAPEKDKRYLVWIGLVIAGLVIGFMTFKMVRDMKEDQPAER